MVSWSKEQIESWDNDFFTMEFIEDIHSIVGVDLVTELANTLEKDRPDLVFSYASALYSYYKLKKEEQNL